MKEYFPLEVAPKLFGVDNALDLEWVKTFLDEMLSRVAEIDGFTWHAYPLHAGASSQVDKEIMDPSFGKTVTV